MSSKRDGEGCFLLKSSFISMGNCRPSVNWADAKVFLLKRVKGWGNPSAIMPRYVSFFRELIVELFLKFFQLAFAWPS